MNTLEQNNELFSLIYYITNIYVKWLCFYSPRNLKNSLASKNMSEDNVKVLVRCRPFNQREAA